MSVQSHYISIIFMLSLFLVVACEDDAPPQDTGVSLTSIAYEPTEWSVTLPAGWPQLEVPVDNPMTNEGIDLGRHLFYDKLLSADGTQSCATCHDPTLGFTDGKAVSTGIDGIAGHCSSMSLVNIGLVLPTPNNDSGILFWDGRSRTLEEQALLPVEDPIELHHEWTTVIKDLQESELYQRLFRQAFGIDNTNDITKELAAKAIAQFERSLLSYNSPFDKWESGTGILTDDQLDGYFRYIDQDSEVPFKKQMECSHCHALPTTTSNDFSNNALQPAQTLMDFDDVGRGAVTGTPDNGKMRVPTLRNIMLTAPYMHDGRFETIEEVIDHYTSGGHYSPTASPFIRDAATPAKDFSEQDKLFMKAFLESLTDTVFLNNPAIQNPFK